ncbi:MAG: hypothetical protein Q9164_006813, partial [Protoblastenia rupestris]
MADPFSIVAGTAGILDVSFRVCKYLKTFRSAVASVELELSALLHDIEALIQVDKSIQQAFTVNLHLLDPQNTPGNAHIDLNNVWQHISTNLSDTQKVLSRLEELLVEEVIGKDGLGVVSRWDAFKKQLRKQSKEGEFQQLRQRVNNHQGTLQVLLGTVQLLYLQRNQSSNDASLTHISDDVRLLSVRLKSQLASFKGSGVNFDINIRNSLQSAAIVASSVSLNKHFTIPQTVSSIYTGRSRILLELRHAFHDRMEPSEWSMQK